jgi:hypothetical protein
LEINRTVVSLNSKQRQGVLELGFQGILDTVVHLNQANINSQVKELRGIVDMTEHKLELPSMNPLPDII